MPNETIVLTRQSNVYTHHNLSDFLPKECQWIQKLVSNAATNDVLRLSGANSPALGANLRVLEASCASQKYFLDSQARREHFEYLWVRNRLRMTK